VVASFKGFTQGAAEGSRVPRRGKPVAGGQRGEVEVASSGASLVVGCSTRSQKEGHLAAEAVREEEMGRRGLGLERYIYTG
jgi:hypothetical protein